MQTAKNNDNMDSPNISVQKSSAESGEKSRLARLREWFTQRMHAGYFKLSLRDRMSSLLSIRHEHHLDPSDADAIRRAAESVSSLPDQLREAAKRAAVDATSILTDVNLPVSFKEIIKAIVEVIPLVLSSDSAVNAAIMAGMAMRHGIIYTGVVSGLVLLVKQFLQRQDEQEPQVELKAGDDSDEDDTAVSDGVISSLYALVHRYTLGSFPTVTPASLLSTAKDANVVFSLARHAEHFGTYLIRLLKWVVNQVWYQVTGTYWFDETQRAIYAEFDELVKVVSYKVEHKELDSGHARSMYKQISELRLRAVKAKMPDEFLRLVSTFFNGFVAAAPDAVQDASTANGHAPVVFGLLGPAGVGKSTLLDAIMGVFLRMRGITYVPAKHRFDYQPALNFQSPLREDTRLFVLDDPQLVAEKESPSLGIFLRVATGVPTEIEQPFGTKGMNLIGHKSPDVLAWLANSLDSKDVTNTSAFYRRFSAGIWTAAVNKGFGLKDNDRMLDPSVIKETTNFDDVWTFTSITGEQTTFSGLVATLLEVADNRTTTNASMSAALAFNIAKTKPGKAISVNVGKMAKLNDFAVNSAAQKGRTDAVLYNYYTSGVGLGKMQSRTELDEATLSTIRVESKTFAEFVAALNAALLLEEKTDPRGDDGEVEDAEPFEAPSIERKGISKELESVIRNSQHHDVAESLVNYMTRSRGEYTLLPNKKVKHTHKDKEDVRNLDDYIGTIAKPGEANKDPDLCCPPDEWGAAEFEYARSQTFYITSTHAAWCDYNYVGSGITEAFGPKAVAVGFPDFARWVLANDLAGEHTTRWALESIRPSESYATKHPLLYAILMAISMTALSTIVALSLNMLFASVIRKGAYSSRDYVKSPSKTMGEVVRKGKYTDTDFILNKVGKNLYPTYCRTGSAGTNAHILGLKWNVAVSVKHLVREYSTAYIGGPIALEIGIEYYPNLKDAAKAKVSNTKAIVVGIEDRDLAFWFFPPNIPFFTDILKFFVSDTTEVDHLTGVVLAKCATEFKAEAGHMLQTPTKPATPFPLGKVVSLGELTASNEPSVLMTRVTSPAAGDCSCPLYTTNNKVGQGHALIFGLFYGTYGEFELGVPVTNEYLAFVMDELKHLCSAVNLKGLPHFGSSLGRVLDPSPHRRTTPPYEDVIVIDGNIAVLPPAEAAHVNIKHELVKSPIHGWANGIQHVDPINNVTSVIDTTGYQLSDLCNVRGAFSKLRFNKPIAEESALEDFATSIRKVYDLIWKYTPDGMVSPAPLPTIIEALNGSSKYGIPAVDLSKARGYWPGCKLKRRTDLAKLMDGTIIPSALLIERVNYLLTNWDKGNYVLPYYVSSIKHETRKKGKYGRVVNAPSFEFVVAVRMHTMPLIGALIAGRIWNGSLVGSDVTGAEAHILTIWLNHHASRGFTIFDLDASGFDSRQSFSYAYHLEEADAKAITQFHPEVSLIRARMVVWTARFCLRVFGNRVTLAYNDMQSGHPLTTYRNTVGMQAMAKSAVTNTPGVALATLGYGDDLLGASKDPEVPLKVVDRAKRLGHELTSARKDSAVGHVSSKEAAILKRRYVGVGTKYYTCSPLDKEVTYKIGDHLRRREAREEEGTRVVAEAALREVFHHGPYNFGIAAERINAKLRAQGFRPLGITFRELEFEAARRGFLPPLTTDFPVVELKSMSTSSRVTLGGDSLGDSVSVSTINLGATVANTPGSGTVTQQRLTTFKDDSGKDVSRNTSVVAAQSKNQFNPYPPVGMENILGRPVQLTQFVFSASTPNIGTPLHFPIDLVSSPALSEKLLPFKFFRSGIEFSARINGQPSTCGIIGFAIFPGGLVDGDVRPQWDLLFNARTMILSASQSTSTSAEVPWSGKSLWCDLEAVTVSDWNARQCCTIVPYVVCPFQSTAPEITSLTVTLFARATDPQVSGFTGTVVSPLRRKLAVEAAKSSGLRFVDKAESSPKADDDAKPTPIARPLVRKSAEANSKSVLGVVDSIGSVLDTIKPVVEGVAAIGGMLDKPESVAAPSPDVVTFLPYYPHTSGLTMATAIGSRQNLHTHQTMRLAGEGNPCPSFQELAAIPGRLISFTVPTSAPAGTVVAAWAVDPSAAVELNSNEFVPTPMSYVANCFSLWRGPIRYMLVFSNPTFQKCTLRITHVPQANATNPIPEDMAGDYVSAVVEIAGDKYFAFEVPYDRPNPYGVVRPVNSNATENTTNGTVIMQIVMPISAAGATVPINGVLYAMAGENFEFVQYIGPRNVGASYTLPPLQRKLVRKATTWDFNKLPFLQLTPFQNRNIVGFVAPDTVMGPTVALKRPHSQAVYTTQDRRTPTDDEYAPLIAEPNTAVSSPWLYWFLPFQGWSGSVTWNVIGAVSNSVFGVSRGGDWNNGTDHIGAVLSNQAITPSVTVVDPWCEPYIYMRVYRDANEISRYSLPLQPFTFFGTSPTLVVVPAAGDDFAFYHFLLCPFFIF